MLSIGVEAGGKRMCLKRNLLKGKEVKKAMDKPKCDKVADVDGITAEILKYGEETVME